jgi:hypothetical protein
MATMLGLTRLVVAQQLRIPLSSQQHGFGSFRVWLSFCDRLPSQLSMVTQAARKGSTAAASEQSGDEENVVKPKIRRKSKPAVSTAEECTEEAAPAAAKKKTTKKATKKAAEAPPQPITASRSYQTPEVVASDLNPLPGRVPEGIIWTEPKQWIVFTDLHVKPATLKTSLKVLHKVHEEAKLRNAGILFLGKLSVA